MNNDDLYLSKLQDYYATHKVLPPYSTLMQLVGFRSKSPVAALVGRLKLAGFLESTPDKRLRPGKRFFERPIYESVRAGFPSPAADAQHDALTIDDYLVEHPSQTVLVTVKGDSMIGAGIHSGDVVVVEKGAPAKLGDIVIALVDNEFTLKYLDKENGKYVLRPANLAYPVIHPRGEMEVFGVVVGQFRKYVR
ncbi:MAG: translesion error-prone DNA polymerase V autoproteolytic subunit [Gammaproteobacteria bacterium]|nr:translesion error-prone DNA polymerase V autoproteolytic subunit [Gammaproteobacteria bacterium]